MAAHDGAAGDVPAREQLARLAETFVELTNTLTDEFDVIEVLDRLAHACVDLLGVSAAGLILVQQDGSPAVVAASDHRARFLDLMQLEHDDGPCVDCLRDGHPVLGAQLEEHRTRWPSFVPKALELGFHSVHAFPLRLRSEVLGGLNLFHSSADAFTDADCRIAQALTDAATVGILQQRALAESVAVARQLQQAFDSRTVIEQAKGMLAEHADLTPEEAFVLLRHYCRNANAKLTATARRIADRTLPLEVVLGDVSKPSAG